MTYFQFVTEVSLQYLYSNPINNFSEQYFEVKTVCLSLKSAAVFDRGFFLHILANTADTKFNSYTSNIVVFIGCRLLVDCRPQSFSYFIQTFKFKTISDDHRQTSLENGVPLTFELSTYTCFELEYLYNYCCTTTTIHIFSDICCHFTG